MRLAVKDNIDMKDVVTTAGSEYFAKTSHAATSDAECLAIARERNVQIVGKTNLSEFAVAPSGLNEYFGTPKNPFSKLRKFIPGGSSSGSAVAVGRGNGGHCLWNGYGGLHPRSRRLLRHRRFEDDLWACFLERRLTG